jgi:phospholipid/cholesterol/gamma-HCH transport system substrate-binding protein
VDRSVEIRVGIVILLAVILFVGGMIWITETRVGDRGYTFEAVFPTVGGLAPGDPVQIGGVERGRVKSVSLRDSDVRVTIWLPSDVKVHDDARVSVESLGLMGEKIVFITIGESPMIVAPGALVRGVYTPGPGEMTAQLSSVLDDLGGVVRSLEEVVGSDSARAMLKQTIANTDRAMSDLRALVAEARPKVATAVGDLSESAKEVHSLVSSKKEKVERTIDRVDAASAHLDSLVENLSAASSTMRRLAAKIDAGEGTIGMLAQDDSLYIDLRKTLDSVDTLLVDIQRNPKRYFKFSIF